MLFGLFIILQILAILLLAACFFGKAPLISVLTAFTSSVLIAGSWVLQIGHEYIWNAGTRAYISEPIYIQTSYLPFINMIIFGLAILFFVYDMFISVSEENESSNTNLNLQSGGGVGLK